MNSIDTNESINQEMNDLIYAKKLQEEEFYSDLLFELLANKLPSRDDKSSKKEDNKFSEEKENNKFLEEKEDNKFLEKKDDTFPKKGESETELEDEFEDDNYITKKIDEMITVCGLKEMHAGRKKYSYHNTNGLYMNDACCWIYYIESVVHCIYTGIITVYKKDGGDDGEKALEMICKLNENLGNIGRIECIYHFQKIKINPNNKRFICSNLF